MCNLPFRMGRQTTVVVAACFLSCVVVAVPDPPNYIKLKTPDVFTVLGPLDPAYKNPCFHSRVDQKFVCLPYFNILGAPKSGTTDFYDKLMVLPQFVPRGKKEPGFWYRPRMSFPEYLHFFSETAAKVKEDPDLVSGDGSTMTFTSAMLQEWENPEIPAESLLPRIMKMIQPQLKPVVMLRNPVDRLESAYYYFGCLHNLTRPGHTYSQNGIYGPENFNDWAKENLRGMKACLATGKDIRTCSQREHYGASHHLTIGIYVVAARNWLDFFGPNEIKFINFDTEFKKDPASTILDFLKFLDLDLPSTEDLHAALEVQANRGLEDTHPDVDWSKLQGCDTPRQPMLPETRKLLEEFYTPYNVELAELLGDDSFLWRPVEQS